MIITADHPDALNIRPYDKSGKLVGGILEVDTDTMIGKQFVDFDIFGNLITKDVDIYKIIGPNIYYERKTTTRLVNTRIIK